MNDRLSALKLFARAARVGNFSRAGRELGLSQPSASRLIAALEEEVGATLFSRTTRAVTLTEAGETYLMRVEAGYTEAGASAKAVRIESSAAATATTAQTAAILSPPCSSDAKKVDTGSSPSSKRNCVGSRRYGSNETLVGGTKNALSESEL